MNAVTDSALTRASLPEIGAPLLNGVFAGISLHGDRPVALVLLADDGGNRPHGDALAWARALDADLPSRTDMLVLYRNRKALGFESGLFWTNETDDQDAGFAWGQSFDYGGQGLGLKSRDFRCRAVRRVAI